MEEIEDNSYS